LDGIWERGLAAGRGGRATASTCTTLLPRYDPRGGRRLEFLAPLLPEWDYLLGWPPRDDPATCLPDFSRARRFSTSDTPAGA
jgi:hypothetical protein